MRGGNSFGSVIIKLPEVPEVLHLEFSPDSILRSQDHDLDLLCICKPSYEIRIDVVVIGLFLYESQRHDGTVTFRALSGKLLALTIYVENERSSIVYVEKGRAGVDNEEGIGDSLGFLEALGIQGNETKTPCQSAAPHSHDICTRCPIPE